MKSKIYLLWSLSLVFLFILGSCKPKESAYKAAYEAAKAREIQDNVVVDEPTPVPDTTPVDSYYPSTETAVQKEKVTVIDGTGLQQFSVVIGSFLNKTNATSLKDRMTNQGFRPTLAQNAMGMYRVIVATFGDKSSAAAERARVKDRYYPEFQDAWILDNQ